MSKKSIENAKNTRKRLKTMVKSGKSHHIRTAGRVTKYGTVGFARNIWLSIASAFVIIITLVVLFATIVSNLVLASITDTMRDKIDITVYFKPETTEETLTKLTTIIKKDPNIRQAQTKTSEQELNRFMEERKNNPEILNAINNPEMREILLKTMNSTMTIKVKNIDNLDSIKHTLDQNPLFADSIDQKRPPSYDTKRAVIERIKNWANIAKTSGITLGSIFLLISILMIFNTIRVAIFSRREEIYMMKLIGANPSFIKGPFLVEAELAGIISGAIASLISLSALKLLLPYLKNAEIDLSLLSELTKFEWSAVIFASMIILGTIIGSVSAHLAMLKYIKRQ